MVIAIVIVLSICVYLAVGIGIASEVARRTNVNDADVDYMAAIWPFVGIVWLTRKAIQKLFPE